MQRLLEALRSQPDIEVFPVDLRLSRSTEDIGRWRIGKIFSVFSAVARVLALRLRHGPMVLYYVPAPGKRGALYRDWVLLSCCRPLQQGLVLHWHAVGLGHWLESNASLAERWLTRAILGRAALSIVQAEAVRIDADQLRPRRCAVIPNGVPDPIRLYTSLAPHRNGTTERPFEVLFAGLGCHPKGLFDALDGVLRANDRDQKLSFRLTAIGPFASAADADEFAARAAAAPGTAQHLGFVSEEQRNILLSQADAFCFPSYYPHEGQPAVLLEALAHDLPVITTTWRAIPENLPVNHIYYVAPRSPAQVASALHEVRRAGRPAGSLRQHYLEHFTTERHHVAMIAALRNVS